MSLNEAQYQAKDGDLCIADSGATHANLKSKKYCFELKPTKRTINTISGPTNLVDGVRKANVVLPNGTQLLIENALFSLKSIRNLLSLRNIYHNGYDTQLRTIGNKKYLPIMDENQAFETLTMLHFVLHYTQINVPQAHMAVEEKYYDPGYSAYVMTVYVPIAPPQRIKMGPQRRLGIYVGYETFSIIRYVEPLTGDVFTACFADFHFNEEIFHSFGGEKKTHEKDVSFSEPSLLFLDPGTNQSETKDKNPCKRKGTEKNSGHEENVLNETQDIKTSPEEEMNDMNKEKSINYSQTNILWDRNEIGDIDEIFSYSVASDIMGGDDAPEPTSVIDCQNRPDWDK
nr:retrovirus-related Pol polyprotein from transposon TNT 1-94 [Tanacetum cinerariifolium]